MQVAGVIGHPITHSLSPGIFSWVAHHFHLPLEYSAHGVLPEDLAEFVRRVRTQPGWVGINVTMPHKENILKFLDLLSPEAQAIGAVNVVHSRGGRLTGHNTDVVGVWATLEKHRCFMEGERALILGAGGAARAVGYALARRQASEVVFCNRDTQRAKDLVQRLAGIFPETRFRAISLAPFEAAEVGFRLDRPFKLLVNTTPVGMAGRSFEVAENSFRIIFEAFALHSSKVFAFDLIYQPEETPFLNLAKKFNLNRMGGLDMLVGQAIQTWKIWFNERFEDRVSSDLLHSDLLEYLRARPIFLTGMMGAGKSSVARALAEKLSWQCLDIDRLIEQETGMAIPDIFRNQGESHFRELEAQVAIQHAFLPRTVIALGGGALHHLPTRQVVQRAGHLVWLSASPRTLARRLNDDAWGNTVGNSLKNSPVKAFSRRPLLGDTFFTLDAQGQEQWIANLLRKREKFYRLAELRMDVDNLSPEEIAQGIIEKMREKKAG